MKNISFTRVVKRCEMLYAEARRSWPRPGDRGRGQGIVAEARGSWPRPGDRGRGQGIVAEARGSWPRPNIRPGGQSPLQALMSLVSTHRDQTGHIIHSTTEVLNMCISK